MRTNDNILNLLREKGAELTRQTLRGLIIQPGAIGDCLLTLPLAAFMKDCLGIGGIDILGHGEYIGILPGRTCVDGIRSIDSVDLHRLFAKTKEFDLSDGDPLINLFADYAWIVTFLGEPNSDFEQNLIFTAHCSHSVEVITLSMKPPEHFSGHLTNFYIQQFIEQSGLSLPSYQVNSSNCLIKATSADLSSGREHLKDIGVDFSKKLVVIQPGSGGSHKCWHLNNFLAVAKKLICEDIEAVFLLGPAEAERFSSATIKNIRSIAKCLTDLSLAGALEVIGCADCYLGNDSGITHLAGALGIKTLAVFGPTNPAVYKPIGPTVTLFTGNAHSFGEEPSFKLQQKVLDVLFANLT